MKTINDDLLNKDVILKQLKDQIIIKHLYKKCNNYYYIFGNKEIILSGREHHIYNAENMCVTNLIRHLNIFNVDFYALLRSLAEIGCMVCGAETKCIITRRKLVISSLCQRCHDEIKKEKKTIQKEIKYKFCKKCNKEFLNTKSGVFCSVECLKKNRRENVFKHMVRFNQKHHWSKTNPNTKLIYDKIAKKNSKTAKRKYASGEMVVWNKNKKMTEKYCENNKRAQLLFWQNLSKEEKDKRRERSRQVAINNLKKQKYKKTSIETKVEEFLNELNISYKYSFFLNKRQFDFGIKDKKILIECHGDYWHGNQRVPKFAHLTEQQKMKKLDDHIKLNIAIKNGYQLIVLWELDINKNPQKVKKILKEKICA